MMSRNWQGLPRIGDRPPVTQEKDAKKVQQNGGGVSSEEDIVLIRAPQLRMIILKSIPQV